MSKQTVANADAENHSSVEGGSAQDDLDSLLNEYEEEQRKEDMPSEDLAARVKMLEERDIREKAEADVKMAVSKVSKQLDFDVPESLVRDMLEGKAKDARFLNAFTSRHQNPGGWDKVLSATTKEFNKLFASISSPDKRATDSHNALASAVANSKSSPSGAKDIDWSKPSDVEFFKMVSSFY